MLDDLRQERTAAVNFDRGQRGDGREKVGDLGALPLRFVGKNRQIVKKGPKSNSLRKDAIISDAEEDQMPLQG
jgi:hypothetical protein